MAALRLLTAPLAPVGGRSSPAHAARVQVHLLQADDSGFAQLRTFASALLLPSERDEFERIRHARSRNRAIAARAWLRLMLSRRLGCPMDRLSLQRSAHGRPECSGTQRGWFNVSHAAGGIAIALVEQPEPAGVRVGVDVEPVGAGAHEDVARLLFGPAELDWLAALEPTQRAHGFLALWTLREAVAKADGRGLSLDVSNIRFDPQANRRHWLRSTGMVSAPAPSMLLSPGRWHCWLHGDADVVCALAVAGCDRIEVALHRHDVDAVARAMQRQAAPASI